MVAWGKRDSERSPRSCANHRFLRPRGGAGEAILLGTSYSAALPGRWEIGFSLTRGCIRRLIDPRLISIAPPGANLLLRPGWPLNPIP